MYLEPATNRFSRIGVRSHDDRITLARDLEARFKNAPELRKVVKAQGRMQEMTTRYVDITPLWASVGDQGLTIAMTILTRKTGREYALHKKEDTGQRYLLQGEPNGILIGEPYGADMVVHTHPQKGDSYAWPSPNDVGALLADPDGKAGVVTIDGWHRDYFADKSAPYGRQVGEARRLWPE